jgi:hypothetical protein
VHRFLADESPRSWQRGAAILAAHDSTRCRSHRMQARCIGWVLLFVGCASGPAGDRGARVRSTTSANANVRPPRLSEPRLGIEGERRQDGLAFNFISCSASRKTSFISLITVERFDPRVPEENGTFVCVLDAGLARFRYSSGTPWMYGTVPPGWEVHGCRTPLEPGTYRIHINGAGRGARGFEVLEDGDMRWLSGSCD